MNVSHLTTQLHLCNPQTEEELKAILDQRWPGPFIPAAELFAAFDLSPFDTSFIKSRLGIQRRYFTTTELAAFLWSRSNYSEDFDHD